jgi:WD40 repeat protein
VSLSSDGQLLLTSGNESRELKKWHVPDLRLIATFTNDDPDTGLPPEVDDSEFSPDGQLIGDSDIFGVKLRNAADGSLIRKIANAEIVSIAFSPDGTLIAGASPTERAVKIWRVADGTLVRTLPVTTDFQFPRVAFTPNGLFIVAVYGSSNTAGAIQFWRVEDGRRVAVFAKPNHVHDIAFSPEPGVFAYTQFSGGVTVSFVRFIR